MELFLSQEFTPEGHRGPTAFQIWNEDDGRYLVREVPYEMPESGRHYETLQSAKSALMSLMVDRGYEPKGPPCRGEEAELRARELQARSLRTTSRRLAGPDLVLTEEQVVKGAFIRQVSTDHVYVVYEVIGRRVEIRNLDGSGAIDLNISRILNNFEPTVTPEVTDRFDRVLFEDMCPEKSRAL